MTVRARPVTKRPNRSRDTQDRRNVYLNLGFLIAVGAAVLILIGVVATTWYDDHLAPAATLNGQVITKDDFKQRLSIETWRLQQQVTRIQTAQSAGRLTSAEAQDRITALNNQVGQDFPAVVLEKIIDSRIQARLAPEQGISVTPQEVDAKQVEDATTPEERHSWIIAFEPQVDEGKTDPTDAQKAAAKAKADKALADLKSGKKWEDVAADSDDATAAQGGDLGWLTKDAAEDKPFLDALFAAQKDQPTGVIEGADGTYRIGRVTDIAPAAVDNAWTNKLALANIKLEDYRAVLQSELIRDKLEAKVVADVEKPGPQRQVAEIVIDAPPTPPGEGALKVRHILYSPNDDPSAASTVAADDPAWGEAETAAKAAYDKLKADPSQFDAIARAESDEESARGEAGSGGKLTAWVEEGDAYVDTFSNPILQSRAKPGDILAPFKTEFGWHVVQVMYPPTDVERLQELKTQAAAGTSFAELARDNSNGPEASKGGELGWVAKGQLDNRLTDAIFAAPVGGYTDVVEIPNDGTYLFKVEKEETRAPDPEQLETLRTTAFSNWYGQIKDDEKITRDLLVPSATDAAG
jgi:parvulin-like peptidyl-prolyl isomerase